VPASLNSIVHVLMYSHYVATTLGASAPWKPLLTTMQIAQFIIIFAQSVLALRRSCGWADFLNALQLGCVEQGGSWRLTARAQVHGVHDRAVQLVFRSRVHGRTARPRQAQAGLKKTAMIRNLPCALAGFKPCNAPSLEMETQQK
jgi:hypothetical protein